VKRLSEITALFDLSLVLDQTLAQQKAQRKAKSKSEVAQFISHFTAASDSVYLGFKIVYNVLILPKVI